uniref:Putative secreted protein n=1 Tax=Anopheles marajoara TaxID=58244 RepID=A0A2M4CAR6_9DIPT
MRSVTTAIRSARMCHQQVYRCCSLMLPALCYASVTAGCTVEGGDNRTTRHKPCRTKKKYPRGVLRAQYEAAVITGCHKEVFFIF